MSVFTDLYKEQKESMQALGQNNNIKTRQFFVSYLESLAYNSFHWEGIPEFYRPQWVEILCFEHRIQCAFDDNGELRILPASPIGVLQENGEYSQYMMYAPNGNVYTRDRKDVEILYNNSLNLSTSEILFQLMDNLNLSMDVIYSFLVRSKIGEHFDCENETVVANITKALNDAIKNGSFFSTAVGSELGDGVNKITLFDSKVSALQPVWENIDKTLGIVHQNFGFVQTESVKRERLTEAEAQDNRDQAQYGLISDMLNNRERWADKINNHEGWNFPPITVTLMRDYNVKPQRPTDREEEINNAEQDDGN